MLFFDMKKSIRYLTDEELAEVIRLGVNGFPDGEEPSTVAGKVFYGQLQANVERDNKLQDRRAVASPYNGAKSVGAPRKGETAEEYQDRQKKHSEIFDKVKDYCWKNGMIEKVKNRDLPEGFTDTLVKLFGEENRNGITQSLNWMAKNMK